MTNQLQVYKCEKCGAMVEMLEGGGGTLFCCHEPMTLQEENTVDAAVEKHIPAIEKSEGRIKVSVGSVAHPMADVHYIEWIELVADGVSYRRFLAPGGEPAATFRLDAAEVTARAYCNVHGLWKS